MKRKIAGGTTSLIDRVFIRDTSQTTKVAGLTGLTSASAGLTLYYCRAGANASTAVTLSAGTLGTWSSGGFVAVDGTNMPGWYEIGVPNAAIASGATSVGLHLRGATNMEDVPLQYELDAVNYQSANDFITGINALSPPANWNALTIDGSGRVDLGKFLGHAVILDGNNYPGVNLVDVAGAQAAYYTGTAQGGSANTITLAAGETNNPLWRQISLVSGTGAGQVAICTAYNSSTKVATVSCPQGTGGNWATSPDSTTLYAIDGLSAMIDSSGNARVLGSIKRNQQLNNFPFYLVLSSDHITGATGKAVTATRNIYDGNGFVACANSPTEDANGWYNVTLAASDLNSATVALRLTAPGCDPVNISLVTNP